MSNVRIVSDIVLGYLLLQAPVYADYPSADRGAAVEQLEQSAMDLNVEIDRLTEHAACPVEHSLTIYIGTDLDNFSLVEVSLNIDDQPGLIKSFGPIQAKSLTRGGWYRLLCVPLSTGQHHLHVEVKSSETAARKTITSLADDLTFETGSLASAIELSVHRKTLISAPVLSLRVLRVLTASNARQTRLGALRGFIGGGSNTNYSPGDADDPNVRNAHYLAGIGARFSALTQLMRIRSDQPNDLLAPDLDFELAAALLDVGMLRAASDTARRARVADKQRSRLVALRLRIASAFYQQGDFATAENLLNELRAGIDRPQLTDWQDLQSRVLLAQGRYAEASSLLMKIQNKADYESYVRYFNLGIVLLKTGHPEQGATVLDRVGEISTENPLLGSLRDRANLTLGYYFLNQLQGATAIPILQRISSSGPYAGRALLGLGWAWLAPSGNKQYKFALGDERTVGPPPEAALNHLPDDNDQNLYQRYGLGPFERADVSDDEHTRLDRALTVWAELKARDRTDPAVQEALLAIGFALDRLGAHDDARKYYEGGVAALDATQAELQAAESYCGDAHWINPLLQNEDDDEPGDPIVVHNLPPPRFAAFLDDVIASDRFQQVLRNDRNLQRLAGRLRAAETKLASGTTDDPAAVETIESLRVRIAALQLQIDAEVKLEREQAKTIAIDDLEAQQRRTRTLSEAGHFALARIFDRS